jgi:hypothetical protein
MQEPTGFTAPENIIVTYNSVAKTITLTGTVNAYWHGVKIEALTSGWVSDAITGAPTAPYYLYYDGSNFVWSTDEWLFSYLQIAYVYYTAAGSFVFARRECHGCMDFRVHRNLHDTVGAYVHEGGGIDPTSIVIGSTTASERRPNVELAVLIDEDLQTILAAKTDKLYNIVTLVGAAISTFTLDQADIVHLNGTVPYYNSYTAPNWGQTPMSNSQYQCLWRIAIPVTSDVASQKYRSLWMQGQSAGTLASQQALTPANLNLGTLGTLSSEHVFVNRVIIQYIGSDWKIVQVDKLTGSKMNMTSTTGGAISIVTTDVSLTGYGTATTPLSVNDAPYILGAGRAGGQTAYGGTLTTQTITVQNNAVDKLGFIINADGSISANTTSYENLITSDNDIPNKKYIDTEAAHSNLNLLESFSDVDNNLYYSGALVNYHSNIATLNFLSMYSGDLYFSGSPISTNVAANNVSFSNTETGLSATNAQAAIDEIVKNMYILM